MKELRDIIVTASNELGEHNEHVVMLKSLLESRLSAQGVSLENKSVFTSGAASVVSDTSNAKKT